MKHLLQNKIVKNVSWLMIEKLARFGINFIIFALIARHLGAETFGKFSYFLALIYLFTPLWTLGINQIVKNQVSLNPDDKNKFLLSGITIKLASSLTILIGSFLYIFFVQNHGISLEDRYLFIILLLSYFFRSFDIFEIWFDSQIKSKYTSMAKLVALSTTSLLYLSALYLKASIIFFACCYSIEFLVMALILTILYTRQEGVLNLKDSIFGIVSKLIKLSWPLFLADSAVTIFTRINQVMIGNILDDKFVGIYAVATRLSEVWLFIPGSICVTYFAPIIIAGKQNSALFDKRIKQLYLVLNAISLTIAIFTTIFSHPLISIVFGAEYLDSAPILNVLIWSNLFVFWGYAQEPWDISMEMLKYRLFRVSIGAFINVILNYFLINHYGCIGAAYSTLISHASAYFLTNAFHPTSRELMAIQIKSLNIKNITNEISAIISAKTQ